MRPTSQRPFWTARSTSFVPWGSREAMLGGLIKTSKMNASASESGAIQPRYESSADELRADRLIWRVIVSVRLEELKVSAAVTSSYSVSGKQMRFAIGADPRRKTATLLQQTPTPDIRCRDLLVICRS